MRRCQGSLKQSFGEIVAVLKVWAVVGVRVKIQIRIIVEEIKFWRKLIDLLIFKSFVI